MKLKIDVKKRILRVQVSKTDFVILNYIFSDRSADIQYLLDTISNLFYYVSKKRKLLCLL